MTDLVERLRKHADGYSNRKTQDYDKVFKDCLSAASMLEVRKMADAVTSMSVNNDAEKYPRLTKLCEIKVDRADSLKELVYHLTANGYEVQTAVIWKEFPASGIDCWQIAIFDKEKK